MFGARLLVCVVLMSFCLLSKQDEDLRKRRSADCSKNITGTNGTFEIPPQNLSGCDFLIQVPVGNIVNLTIAEWKYNGEFRIEIFDIDDNLLGSLGDTSFTDSESVYTSTTPGMIIHVNRTTAGDRDIQCTYSAVEAAPLVVPQQDAFEVPEGSNLTLVCMVNSTLSPLQEVTWEKINDECVVYLFNATDKHDFLETRGLYSLIINDASPSDQGTYKCHAKNRAGASSSQPINVTVISDCGKNITGTNGTFEIPPRNISSCDFLIQLPVGNIVNLTITEWKPNGALRIEIFDIDDKLFGSLEDTSFTDSESVYISSTPGMTIHVNRTTEGDIQCIYSAMEAAPLVVPQKYVYEVTEGSNLTLVCLVNSTLSPLQEVTWEKINDEGIIYPINATDKYDFLETLGLYSLIINDLSPSDQGTYKCHAKNRAGASSSQPINVTVISEQEQVGVCQPGWTKYKNHCYKLNLDELNWGDAEKYCNDMTASLVYIENSAENEWLSDLCSDACWIGINDKQQEGHWVWSHNMTTTNYTAWSIGEPNNSTEFENCGIFYRCSGWNDVNCRQIHKFICKRSTDKDECKDENPCPQMCENTFGSYNCRCWQGYNGDGRNCLIDADQIGLQLKSIFLQVTIEGDGIWNTSLTDNTTLYYKLLSSNFSAGVKKLLGNLPHYRQTRIISFSQGSVIVNAFIIVDKSANTTLYYDHISQNSSTFSTFLPGRVEIQPTNDSASLGFIQRVNITGNRIFHFHEGEDIEIKCEAEAVSVTGKLDFSWTLNGYLVRPTRSSRIKITYSKTEAVKYISTLHISNFKQSDEGNFTCTAFIENATKDVNATAIMYRFNLESSNTAVKTGANVTATCTVYPETEFANESLKFCIDMKPVDDDNTTIKYEQNQAILTVVSLTRNVSITCGFTAKLCSQQKKIRIAVFEPDYYPCPNQTDEKNLTWPETYAGFTAKIRCPSGFTGIISRTCRKDGYNGIWLDPSFTSCTREEIAKIENKLDRIENGVQVDKLVNVIRDFRNTSEEIVQTNFTSSDIRAGVQVLAKVSAIVTSREENITVEETEEFFKATDVLLSGESKESWQGLYTETKDNGAARVMDIVGNIFNRAMENLVVDDRISVDGKNVVLLIEKTRISSIAFPKNKTSEITSEVELSEETINKSLTVATSVKYSVAYYKTLGDFLPNSLGKEEIGSTILAFSLPDSDILLDPPIRMTFKTKKTNLPGRLCSYWNQTRGAWAGDGCRATAVNETFTECKCNHLTNFAVLISVKEISKDHHEAMSIISLVGFITSIVFLIVTLAVYIHFWRHLESDKAVILIIMCIILILAYLTFLFGIEQTENKFTNLIGQYMFYQPDERMKNFGLRTQSIYFHQNICTAVAVTLHYLFLVFVCLMASEGIIHAVMVVCVFKQTQFINRILIPMSFGVPLVIVAVSGAITQLDGYGTDKFCWLATGNGLIYSFLGPCYAVVIINLVITGLLLKKLFSTKGTMNKTKREKIWTGIRSLLILAPVFGLTWLFGFFYFHDDAVAFAYLFVIFNSLQGLLIFIMHTLMNQTVKIQMTRTMGKLKNKKETVSTVNNSTWKKIFKEIQDKASTDTKLTTNTKSTTDGAGLESSISESTYELKANGENSAIEESCTPMTNIIQRNLQTDDEVGVVSNPTYRMISIEKTHVLNESETDAASLTNS